MIKKKNHSRGGAGDILGADGVQRGSGGMSQSSWSGIGGMAESCVADGFAEVTSFWAGAGPHTAADSEKVKLLIQLQALLQMLHSPQIRKEFCLGKIIVSGDCEEILLSLDSIYNVLFPTYSGPGWCQVSKLISNAAAHFELLYYKSPELFHVSCGDLTMEEHSYATWMNTSNNIMNSKYWQQQTHQPNVGITNEPKTTNICQHSEITAESLSGFEQHRRRRVLQNVIMGYEPKSLVQGEEELLSSAMEELPGPIVGMMLKHQDPPAAPLWSSWEQAQVRQEGVGNFAKKGVQDPQDLLWSMQT